MTQAPIDEMIKECHSVYKLVVMAARRAKELAQGAPKLIHTDLKKVSSIALEEILQGKVTLKPLEEDSEPAKKKSRAKSEKSNAAEPAAVGGKKKK